MNAVRIVVDGAPVAKGRPRATTIGGRARMYTPGKTRAFETLLAGAAREAMAGRSIIEGPVAVTVHALVPIPASWSKRKKASAADGAIRPTSKPDSDNYLKTLDALNGIVFADDAQIVDARVAKFYSARPCLTVEIEAA